MSFNIDNLYKKNAGTAERTNVIIFLILIKYIAMLNNETRFFASSYFSN